MRGNNRHGDSVRGASTLLGADRHCRYAQPLLDGVRGMVDGRDRDLLRRLADIGGRIMTC